MKTMLFNPYTGTPRHPSDIASDPEGILLLDPDEPVKAAPTAIKPPKASRPEARPGAEADVNETNAVLASRYLDLLRVVESYEKHGVTCQTFRHFVAAPCAECNSTLPSPQASQPAQDAADAENPLADQHRANYEWAHAGWEACKQECDRLRDLLADVGIQP